MSAQSDAKDQIIDMQRGQIERLRNERDKGYRLPALLLAFVVGVATGGTVWFFLT